MRVVSLGSGSSGNALLVEAGPKGRTRLLVDAGLSTKLLVQRLRGVGVQPSQVQGVLVTHEHSDHVIGLPGLMQHYAIPMIGDQQTWSAIAEGLQAGSWRTDSGKLVPSPLEDNVEVRNEEVARGTTDSKSKVYERETKYIIKSTMSVEKSFMQLTMENIDNIYVQETIKEIDEMSFIEHDYVQRGKSEVRYFPSIDLPVGGRRVFGDIEVTSFPISHDAVAPCGYLLRAGGCRVCVVTDSGEVTAEMLAMMEQADLLVLEANHDRERLIRGPYPWPLKKRILSSTGHLSNDQTAEAVLRTWPVGSVRWLWLAHLSRTNNTPKLALASIRAYLQAAKANLAQIHVSVLPPEGGLIWDSTQLWHASSLWDMDV